MEPQVASERALVMLCNTPFNTNCSRGTLAVFSVAKNKGSSFEAFPFAILRANTYCCKVTLDASAVPIGGESPELQLASTRGSSSMTRQKDQSRRHQLSQSSRGAELGLWF